MAGFEQVPPMPLLLPRGGMKVRLRIENHRDSAIEVPSSDRLRLMNSDREILPVAQVPGSGDWWMPFDVPAAASATVTVTVASTQPIAGGSIEIPGVREGGGSLFGRTCTVTGAF
ncbi:MAG: hypothetical protein D6729_14180 [Deltaproteobacteria bacterium]|nr:MAG: hypothetical protein D6729_14180 [Deltaproteobacteria bacterium]